MRRWTLVVCVAAAMIAPLSIAQHAQEQAAPTQAAPTQPQTQTQTQTPTPAPTLRIGVTAVEVDTVVTDGSGRHIPDLTIGDFELLQDGKPQTITSFRYVPIRPSPDAAATAAPRGTGRSATAPVPLTNSAQLQNNHTGRVMAIVIDDLNITFMTMARLRDALDTFIDRDMRPDDAVAIVVTSRGVGRLQQFTNDKAVLKETAAGLRANFFGIFDEDDPNAKRTDQEKATIDFVDDTLRAGTFGAVDNIIRGMRDLPGRKSVILVSEGFALVSRNGEFLTQQPQMLEAFRRLVDESNRSSVVIHTMDARGVTNPVKSAFSGERKDSFQRFEISNLISKDMDLRAGPKLLAQQAGGLAFVANDFSLGFKQALGDQEGYYVLGYQPESATFQRGANNRIAFHQIKVVVKRAGLKTRARSGFYGVTDAELRPEPRTTEQRLFAAASSPFIANDLGVHVTPIYGHTTDGDMFRVLLHIDGQGLSFTKTDDGEYRAPVEMLAMLIDGRGATIQSKMYSFALRADTAPDAAKLDAGFTGSVDVVAPKPGAYQLRIAVRDATSGRTGTGYRFVRAPNLTTERLALSGVALASGEETERRASSAVRRFTPSSTLLYAFDAYNARLDPANHHPSLTLRLRLYRDGSLLLDGKPTAIDAQPRDEDPNRTAKVTGELQLSSAIPAGEYQLQIEVNDRLARGAAATAHEWVDFTITSTRTP
jgi:VWFA-related protein